MSTSETTVDTAELMKGLQHELQMKDMSKISMKEDRIAWDKITADDNENVRFYAGQKIGGVTLEKDLRDIPGMVMQILPIGDITEPLWVSEREDGSLHLLRGFRRYHGAKFIRENEPHRGTPLAKTLETLPVRIVSGLTREQEKRLVNDQQSLDFSAGEVYKAFKDALRGGADWAMEAYRMYPQIARVTGSLTKAAEVRAMPDGEEKREAVKKWLNQFANQFWRSSMLCGHYVEDLVTRQYLFADGYISQKPEIKVTAPIMVKIAKAYKEDVNAGEYDADKGYGPRMDALFTELKTSQSAEKTPKEYNFKPIQEVIDLAKMVASDGKYKLAPTLIRLAFKNQAAPEVVATVNNFDNCRTVFNAHAAYVKPELREILATVFTSPDGAGKLEELLASNYATPTEAQPQPQTETVEAEAEEAHKGSKRKTAKK